MIIRCCDVETTGKEPTDEVVEIGWHEIRHGTLCSTGMRTFVKPARKIPPSASAIHHISDVEVADAPPWTEAWRILIADKPVDEELVLAAHVASFERQFLDPLITTRWMCTWKCALRQWPDMESHSLQALLYALDLRVGNDRALLNPAHRAQPDAFACGLLLTELLDHQSIETLIAWSSEPAVLTKFDFGKFDGKPLSAADDGFLTWMLGKDFSDDWKWNVQRELDRRAAVKRDARIKKWVDGVRSAATVKDLENWWFGEAEAFAAERIIPGTEEYTLLVGEAAARKTALLAAPGPDFGGAPAS
ncbi:exonuclease domain-containing protein [Bradyrhizobium barranii subsp. apii]|uniref:3'-5' exonuclease n=1 Tax=Bradyrhizobium barranii TaxID=2992140 RepID=UPI001AA109BE|nr:exonuclease domain-containing protein [Bradyrhizobium barranii]UPT99302.1 exonuclease domain-containing protein [Bradyrhizobium barranii subsp. apii]